MVDSVDKQFTDWQKTWVDYIDQDVTLIDSHIEKLKQMSGQPWTHPRQNMRWLWDYLIHRKAELCGNQPTQTPA
jgi:hypothetical protein